MPCPPFAPLCLSDLTEGTQLVLHAFRAAIFEHDGSRVSDPALRSAFGIDVGRLDGELFLFTRVLGHLSGRRIAVATPHCTRVTYDEVALLCALSAAQAWDEEASAAHLAQVTGVEARRGRLSSVMVRIADLFAGAGLSIVVPGALRRVPQAVTPAFRVA